MFRMRLLRILGGWFFGDGVGGVAVLTTVTTMANLTSYATRTPGTGLGARLSSLSCSVNVTRARNLGNCLMKHVSISATCVTRFVGNMARNTGGAKGGRTTCVTNLRVNRRVDGRVVGNVGRRLFNRSSMGAVDGRGFLTNFVTNALRGNNLVAVRGTRSCARATVRTVGTGTVRRGCTSGGTTNRGFLTRGGAGRNMGAAPDKLRCGMVARNGNRVPTSAYGIGMGCGNALVSNARFSDSCGHGRPAAFHTGRIVGN